MRPPDMTAPRDPGEDQGARGSKSDFKKSPKHSKTRQQLLWEQIASLRDAALAHRRRADRTEGPEHEASYLAWTDLRLEIARLLNELRSA